MIRPDRFSTGPMRRKCDDRRETYSMTILAPFYVTLVLAAQAPAGAQNAADAGAVRLKFMRDSLRSYQLSTSGEGGGSLKLVEKPVFRLGKQGADDLEDGAIFLWTADSGRPEAAIQVFLIKHPKEPEGNWYHEFTSLAPSTISAASDGRPQWAPTMPGLEFKPMSDAPKPAQSAAQRIRQMRSLAERFRASDNFWHRGWSELRLLPTPVTRYGRAETKLVDGALFAFVLGTDPEVFLFIETGPSSDGLEWQYALAPMSAFALKGSYQGKPVWEVPDRMPASDPSKPLFSQRLKFSE
jgi:hypothetical protein